MASEPAIHVRQLWKSTAGRPVLRGIDLDLMPGEHVLLRGENGSGKSTLLGCLAGLRRPDAGSIAWFGLPPAPESNRLIGFVAHDFHLEPGLTLNESLVLAARLHGLRQAAALATRWLQLAALSHYAGRLPREVSHGVRRRASIARALIHDPPILLLDEPFSGLDHASREWLRELLASRAASGFTNLVATHDEPDASETRVLTLSRGLLREPQPPVFLAPQAATRAHRSSPEGSARLRA